MVRFARARGSKASNERQPEQATSWIEMKQQISQQVSEEISENAQIIKNIVKNKHNKSDVKSEWAEFPHTPPINANGGLKLQHNKVKKAKPLNLKQAVQSHNLNAKQLAVNETVKHSQKNVFMSNKVEQVDDDAPEEISAKIETVFPTKLSKKSPKKNQQKVKILPVNNGQKQLNNTKSPAPKKLLAELNEEELKKVEKKKQKRLNQIEKRNKFKNDKLEAKKSMGPVPNQSTKKVKLLGKDNSNKHSRRKPITNEPQTMTINGKVIEIVRFDGYPIKKSDGETLAALRKQLISKGIPHSEVSRTMKLERRKAEKSLQRERKKVCFNCRTSGHNLAECPEIGRDPLKQETCGTGICFKCGSTEHTHFECKVVHHQEFKFAVCFVCHEQGHLARQCPDNAKGLYPKGGACRECGDVTHLKKDCPKFQANQEEYKISLQTIDDSKLESLDDENVASEAPVVIVQKVVKF